MEYHASPVGGHAGIKRTLARLKKEFHWKGMNEDVSKFLQHCLVCQQAKSQNVTCRAIATITNTSLNLGDVAMNFITGLPNSFGFTVIMVVVDRLSKYGHFAPLKTNYNSRMVAKVFMQHIVKLRGMPKSIVSNRDQIFTSQFWQHLFKL